MSRRIVLFALVTITWLCTNLTGHADEIRDRQKQLYQAVVRSINTAGQNYVDGNGDASAASITAAAKEFRELIAISSPEDYDKLTPTMMQIERAHAMLQLEGVSVEPLFIPSRPTTTPTTLPSSNPSASSMPAAPVAVMPKPTPPKPTPPAPKKPAPPMNNGISFTSVIQPILVGRCGQCHVSGSKGGFQMTSYETLMKGPSEGVVVFPGDVIASRLIETIETGDMPRGGGKVPANELVALKTWIAQGAKFDGPDPTMSFSGAPAMAAPAADTPMVVRATGKETVSFASHIAPLLVDNCGGCHIDAMQARGGLRMDTFAQMLRGGDSGSVITPGKGEASLLVRKLRGSEGDRMPAGGRPALSDESISLVSKWIDEGATLDGASENQPITVMSQMAWVAKATPAQVSERRLKLANEHFALANAANAAIHQETTEHFHVLGTASAGTLKLVAEQAELLLPQTKTLVGGPNGEAYYRGRATIFVLPKRYDYSEFAKMVEQRGVPNDWNSHWQFDGIDAYVAVVATDRDELEVISQRLVTPIAALAMATRGGDVPRWLAEGVGVNLSASGRGLLDRDARRKLEAEIYEAASAAKNSKQFLESKLTPEQSDRIGTAIVSTMVDRSRRRQFDAMLRELESGTAFDTAFAKSFGANIASYVDGWLGMVQK